MNPTISKYMSELGRRGRGVRKNFSPEYKLELTKRLLKGQKAFLARKKKEKKNQCPHGRTRPGKQNGD